MTGSELLWTNGDYMRRVERLLSSIDEDERASLLADLRDRFDDVEDEGPVDHLGTPEEFVAEYRRSAGIDDDATRPIEDIDSSPVVRIDSLISAAALPFGILLLFSFGGQLIFGPFALAVEWILARMSPRPLQMIWSSLAGVLVGEITYLVIEQMTDSRYPHSIYGVPYTAIAVVVGCISAVLVYRTASSGRSR